MAFEVQFEVCSQICLLRRKMADNPARCLHLNDGQGGCSMNRRIKMSGVCLVALGLMAITVPATSATAQTSGEKTWTGVVSDSRCGLKHSTPSDEAAMCVEKCVGNGAKYVLVSHGEVFQLSDQDKFGEFAGKSVTVAGTLNGKTIEVTSVEEAGI
jgi:Protein of unknown function (DUF5818)